MIETVIIVFILIYSIILHEISHGIVALWNGDPTAQKAGRLSLNPLKHIDPVGTLLLPGILVLLKSPILFGWAKPVPIEPRLFRNRSLGVFTVGIAGPLTNLLLAAGFALGVRLISHEDAVWPFLLYGVSANIFLALFNLVPIPPLDGSRAVGVFLPMSLKRAYYSMERFGFFILLILLHFGILQKLLMPVFNRIFFLLTGIENA